jgi:hypothetical protein
MRVIRTRDVTFDHTRFYDPADIDLASVMIVEEMVECLEMPESTFVGVVIEEDGDNLHTSMEVVDQPNHTDLHTGMKDTDPAGDDQKPLDNFHTGANAGELLTPEMTPESVGQQIPETQISQDNQPTPGPSESGENTRSRRGRRFDPPPADSIAMNTRSRKQAYAAALTTVSDLAPYYGAFVASMERPPVEKSVCTETRYLRSPGTGNR